MRFGEAWGATTVGTLRGTPNLRVIVRRPVCAKACLRLVDVRGDTRLVSSLLIGVG